MPTPEKTGIDVIEDWFGDLMRPGDGEVLRKALDAAGWEIKRKKVTGVSPQKAGGDARARKLPAERRREIARNAANARWNPNERSRQPEG